MSTVLLLLPIVTGVAWPAYATLVSGVAVSMGYRLMTELNAQETVTLKSDIQTSEDVCEVPVESTSKIVATMKDGDSLNFTNGNYDITFIKDARGTCSCRVKGSGGKRVAKKTLEAEAKKLINKVTQTYVYNKLKTELSQKGYNIVTDEASENNTIKLSVRKWK
ncbi:MAG TPA: DUF1257 domain-containing protein [Candidatus Wallbacteria bacterium]|nr:DUF1257 domain-containing protein [Candidatus Wallbacteria bacterium]